MVLLISTLTIGQNTNDINQVLNDLVFYSGKYVSPATEAVVYQASSGWMFSPKLKKEWSFTLGINTNVFIVPNSNRNFEIKNSDFQTFKIVGVNDDRVVNVPTTLGDKSDFYIQTNFLGNPIKTRFDGINQEQVIYPYLQGSIALPKGFELMAKYSLKNNLKNGSYQIYGAALQYNISQHFSKLKEKNISIATLFAYNKEDLEANVILASGSNNLLGLKRLVSDVSSFQWQINASKTFKKIEVMAGFVINSSNIKYNFEFEEVQQLNANDLLNSKIKDLDKTQYIYFGELSGRYNFYKNFYFQSTFSFGSEFNSNFGVQYEFN
ncbi:MAG: DUF6588 family protein [Flavobacterium sp.]